MIRPGCGPRCAARVRAATGRRAAMRITASRPLLPVQPSCYRCPLAFDRGARMGVTPCARDLDHSRNIIAPALTAAAPGRYACGLGKQRCACPVPVSATGCSTRSAVNYMRICARGVRIIVEPGSFRLREQGHAYHGRSAWHKWLRPTVPRSPQRLCQPRHFRVAQSQHKPPAQRAYTGRSRESSPTPLKRRLLIRPRSRALGKTGCGWIGKTTSFLSRLDTRHAPRTSNTA